MSPESVTASQANIRKAIALIDRQQGGGGTRLLSAMQRAFAMPQDESVSRSLLVVTDGYVSAERDVFSLIRENLNKANVFAFGIGSSVNRYLIEGMARAGRGEPFIVTNSSEAPQRAAVFRRYVESPVLTAIGVSYDGFEAYDVEPTSIPDLLAQRPLLVFGKWRGQPRGTITLRGTSGTGQYLRKFDVASTRPMAQHRPLRYLWARTRVAALSDFNFAVQDDELIREITSLGLTYDLLTRHTAFVAVHEVIRNPGADAQDVKQPLPLPEGVSELAVGQGQTSGPRVSNPSVAGPAKEVPEPGFYLLLLLSAIGLAGVSLGRHLLAHRRANQ